MNVLRAVPGSILWLLAPSRAAGNGGAILRNLRREAAARGVAPSRLVFAPRRTKRAHLERMKHADLFLDSFVYGAHSTATDALRGGLPVLTVRGDNFASRVATSLLLNVGLPEMGSASAKVYERVAVALARGAMQRRSGVRRSLKIRRRDSALSGVRKGHAEMSGVLGVLARRLQDGFPPSNTSEPTPPPPSESPRRMSRIWCMYQMGDCRRFTLRTTRTRLSACRVHARSASCIVWQQGESWSLIP